MASGRTRQFPPRTASEREGRDGDRKKVGERESRGRGRGRRRGYSHSGREEFAKTVGQDSEQRENRRRRNLASSVGALQLESKGGRGEGRGEGGRLGKEQLRRREEKVSEGIRAWRGGRAGYQHVRPLVGSVWSEYVRVLGVEMELAVREGLGQRVWRNVHYPIIELLRKTGQSFGVLLQLVRYVCLCVV